jgi:hypothetical protein
VIAENQKYKFMEQNKEEQKKLLTEIMEADEKDGLYNQQTAVQWIVEQLQAPCRGIPSHIIEQAKEMEKGQHDNTWIQSRIEYQGDDYIGKEKTFEQYYNETYGKL